jgi:ABC-2 type transport system ATP-binding protein
MIRLDGITKRYEKFILAPTYFTLEEGEIVSLIGANGAGKSTLIKCLCGIIDADKGNIYVNDKQVKKIDDVMTCGFLNQEQNIYESVRIKDIIAFVKSIMGKKFDNEIFDTYFNKIFKLDDTYKVKELSTGMRVKFFLSIELAKKPEFLVLDEPTSGLDPIIREEVLDILRKIATKNSTTILFSSHITEDIEKIADRVIYIDDGEIKINDTKENIKNSYVRIEEEQYSLIKSCISNEKSVRVQDYYIVKKGSIEGLGVSYREALLGDILSYIRKGVE